MEIVLLLEVTDYNQVVVYSPNEKKEYTVDVTDDQSELYQNMLNSVEDDEDVFVNFDKRNMKLVYLDSEWKAYGENNICWNYDKQLQNVYTKRKGVNGLVRRKKSFADKKKQIDELTDKMNESIKSYQNDPEEELKLLKYLQQFRKYSARNITLIESQYKGAVGVASYKQHQEKGYNVQKGEKAIRILAPRMQKVFRDKNNQEKFLSKATVEEKKKVESGEIKVQNKLVGYINVPVFDITQTDCPEVDYPKLYPNRPETFKFEGTEEEFETFNQAVYDYAKSQNVPVLNGKTNSAAKGYYAPADNFILLRDDLSKTEETKVLLHELAHAQMHNEQKLKEKNMKIIDTRVIEYQAEMTAYVVSSTFKLDTEDYSKMYLANWTKKDVENEDYLKSLEEVKKVSGRMIEDITHRYNSLQQEKGQYLKEGVSMLSDEMIADRLKFFTDKNGKNYYNELKDTKLKCTKISSKDQPAGKYQIHTVRLETKDNQVFTEKIHTSKIDTKELKKWEKGMTGKEWLDRNFLRDVLREHPDLSERNINGIHFDNEDYEDKLQDISEVTKSKEKTQSL